MIKFFRKIRQKLLTENKLSKYLIYAIGEIILVVIGILIALYINNWNQQHINAATEVEIIQALKSDVESNLVQYNGYQDLVNVKINVLTAILNGTYDSIQKIEVMNAEQIDIYCTRYKYNLPVQDHIFKETMNGGSNGLISSDELRRSIFDYYTTIEDSKEAMTTGASRWPSLLSSMIPGEYYESSKDPEIIVDISPEGETILIKRLKEDIEHIRPTINEEIQYAMRALRNLKRLKREANNLIPLLDIELKNKTHD